MASRTRLTLALGLAACSMWAHAAEPQVFVQAGTSMARGETLGLEDVGIQGRRLQSSKTSTSDSHAQAQSDAQLIGAVLAAAFCLHWFVKGYRNYSAIKLLDVDDCQAKMMSAWGAKSESENLPETLRGVFWMDGNYAPECLAIFMNGAFDPKKRTISLPIGGPYGWTWNSDRAGWFVYFLIVWAGYALFGATLRVEFNEDYTVASIPLYLFNCIWIPTGYMMIREDAQGNSWNRATYSLWVACGLRSYTDPRELRWSYQLRKVVDGSGEKLLNWKDLEDSLDKAPLNKTRMQRIQGFPGEPTAEASKLLAAVE
ncbi:unnamed protein product [Polarella glacialis]|uniref:Uncharacterized protein n=1 Tax=Polarella glacialis TaxID=89957 RepID=A0A813JLM8_POLGL|nr:unnamed protein product [Polarella glacialis]CAE8679804.1 unnamed protein product [Polarella glacialis]|mmetsp:Transcript_90138/g.162575  ORF Transcript_90138/g.162575 Transcript_90138/m.162575 type:complete len:314 (-) Transcript_90138:91-1032(-)